MTTSTEEDLELEEADYGNQELLWSEKETVCPALCYAVAITMLLAGTVLVGAKFLLRFDFLDYIRRIIM